MRRSHYLSFFPLHFTYMIYFTFLSWPIHAMCLGCCSYYGMGGSTMCYSNKVKTLFCCQEPVTNHCKLVDMWLDMWGWEVNSHKSYTRFSFWCDCSIEYLKMSQTSWLLFQCIGFSSPVIPRALTGCILALLTETTGQQPRLENMLEIVF